MICGISTAPTDHGDPKRIRNSVELALTLLQVSYIDLFLIHWPGKSGVPEDSVDNVELRAETWKTLVDLKSEGLLKSIGVSNYNIRHLQQLLKNGYGVKPSVNQVGFTSYMGDTKTVGYFNWNILQVECHPHYRQTELIKFCDQEGIHVQAYSSLGTGNYKSLLKDPVVERIATELDVSPARVLLKWAVQQNIGKIIKK